MEQVIWRYVKGYEDRYEVSSTGIVRSLNVEVKCRGNGTRVIKGKTLPARANNRGYLTVNLCRDSVMRTKLVHRLVAEAFIDNKLNKPQVNHIDNDAMNNAVSNLEWVTDDENKMHSSIRCGGTQRPKKPVEAVCVKTGVKQLFDGLRAAERALGLEHKSALNVINGKRKSHRGYIISYVEGGDAHAHIDDCNAE